MPTVGRIAIRLELVSLRLDRPLRESPRGRDARGASPVVLRMERLLLALASVSCTAETESNDPDKFEVLPSNGCAKCSEEFRDGRPSATAGRCLAGGDATRLNGCCCCEVEDDTPRSSWSAGSIGLTVMIDEGSIENGRPLCTSSMIPTRLRPEGDTATESPASDDRSGGLTAN